MIELRGIHKFFNKGRQNEIHVINDISLSLPERGMVAIFGKSGCGKTTLLNVIGGLDGIREGSITVQGQDISRNTDDLRNRYMGYIFQNYNLNKNETCFENVANALYLCGVTDAQTVSERVMAALANVGMEKYAKRTPDTLSGGQQQRIAIARAIVKNPRIILADEPTGNLDEANTVMIMDLLKQIARDHLVLLVTHEANLVDYYCDSIVELRDGAVVSVKQNSGANGFFARDKNDIFLGELKKTTMGDTNAEIEYYGEDLHVPVRLKLINNAGKLYLQVEGGSVQILDESSEIKLREGVFEERKRENEISAAIDMQKLPPVEGSHYGKLFSLKSSVKSGYVSNFRKQKRGTRLLRRCMVLFAAVVVFMSAVFATPIADLLKAKEAYNHNVFYVYTPDQAVSSTLNEAVGDAASGIDYLHLMYNVPSGDDTVKFMTGFFETFQSSYYDEAFETNAVLLGISLAEQLPLVEGKKEGIDEYEVVITTRVADALLKTSSLGYISEYRDLLGLVSNRIAVDGKSIRIAGIVESDEPAMYMTELAIAKRAVRPYLTPIALGSAYGVDLEEGQTAYVALQHSAGTGLPAVGNTVEVQGKKLTIASVVRHYQTYDEWLAGNGIKKDSIEVYFSKNHNVKPSDPDWESEYNVHYAEYLDYRYDRLADFVRDYSHFARDICAWLYLEKGMENALYNFAGSEYALLQMYRQKYGNTPTQQELENNIEPLKRARDEEMTNFYKMYEREFEKNASVNMLYQNTYLVSEADFIAYSKQLYSTFSNNKDYGDLEKEVAYAADYFVSDSIMVAGEFAYTVIHSTNPEVTEAWLAKTFPDLNSASDYLPTILTPDNIFDRLIEDQTEGITVAFISMGVMLVFMSVCMYFIMRSSLMGRIREVGIYRAIGVSKKNLVFKFFIESLVLTTLTVLVGYLFSGAFITVCLNLSPLCEQFFFFPLWFALCDLAILYALCALCGILPILTLLKRTPSAILAKYDI